MAGCHCLRTLVPVLVLALAIAWTFARGMTLGISLGTQGARQLQFWRELGQVPARAPACPFPTAELTLARVMAVVCNSTYVDDSAAAALIPYNGADLPTSDPDVPDGSECHGETTSSCGIKDGVRARQHLVNLIYADSDVHGDASATGTDGNTQDNDSGLPPSVIAASRRGRREIAQMLAPFGRFEVVGGATADPKVVERSITNRAWSWVIKAISKVIGLSHPIAAWVLTEAQRLDLWWLDNAYDIVPALLATNADAPGDLYLFVRGSITMAEWIHDSDIALVNGTHAGYERMANALWPQLRPQLAAAITDRGKAIGTGIVTVNVAGHSLGAGVATILARHCADAFGPRSPAEVKLYTYGSPRVYSTEMAALFEKSQASTRRFVALHDPVCQFPVSALKDFDSEPPAEQLRQGLVYEHIGQGFELGPYPPAEGTYGCIGNVANMPANSITAAVNHHIVHYIDLLFNVVKPSP
jgi:hypothetical protein